MADVTVGRARYRSHAPSRSRSGLGTMRRNPASAWRHVDAVLVGCIAALSLVGALMVYSSTRGVDGDTTSFAFRQVLFLVAGLVLMVAVSLVDYRKFRDWAAFLYGGSVLLLLLVLTPIGSESSGTQGWFQLGAFQLQPSEFAKIAVIVGMATVASSFRGDIDLRRLGVLLGLAAVPTALVLLQPDLGTAMIFGAIMVGIVLVAGARARHIAALALVAIIGVIGLLNSESLEEYQRVRLTAFLDQDTNLQGEAYNLDQAKTAVASGGWLGKGLFQGTQTRLEYVPEQHTDFIFTAVGEELGFVGSATVLSLFSVIIWRVWRTAQLSRDEYGSLVCAGVFALFMFQVFQNIGMTVGIMPITGIPLPFMSYGGSSTLTVFILMGLVLNVHMRRFA